MASGAASDAASGGRGLRAHTSERADVLVDTLAELLATDPPADPFAPEVVAVPTRGVERWVAQRLSHRLGALGAPSAAGDGNGDGAPDGTVAESGVCANVAFASPARLVHRAVAAASGIDPDDDPWQPERLAWHVLDVVDRAVGEREPWAAPLTRYLVDPPGSGPDDGVRAGRRMRLAQAVAGRFSSYASQRPSLTVGWAAGRDDDGCGVPLPDDLVWQAHLWRAVRARLDVPDPAGRLAVATRALRDDPALADLPQRLSVFGPTRLPEAHLDVLDALAAHRDVHLWLPHPSDALWQRTSRWATTAPAGAAHAPRRADVPDLASAPLLGSLAQDATELGLRLAARGAEVLHHPAPPPPPTVLGLLQSALRADSRGAVGSTGDRAAGAAADRSVQVHACHGRSRQVEVLREAVVGLLADDPSLEPRDVVVLCPDVEAFAPLVVATFGAPGDVDGVDGPASGSGGRGGGGRPPHPGRTLRVRVADRSPARTNPLLRVVADVLELAGSRVTASAVVDLAGLEAVRRRFGFDDTDLERLRAWALRSGVRWGEDATRRARFGLGAVGQGTWEAAIDRLLLGVAMADEDDRFLGATLPLDDVGSTDVELAGRFAELVDRLTGVLDALRGEHPAHAWFDTLDTLLTLLGDVAAPAQWQRVEARAVLADARASATGASGASGAPGTDDGAAGSRLRLPDVVALLAPRLAGRPTRAGFRTGAVTVCSLEPMRAVPHRVVCLLGMDDAAFPRVTTTHGDDVLARDPLVGERDRRAEDRQLFLDAVMSASDHLVVVHSGADERTGRPMPPAVPVGELLDAIDEAVDLHGPDGTPTTARASLVVHHPLQAVDERNFTRDALGRPGPFSFDVVERDAALVARRPRAGHAVLLDAPLPDPVTGDERTTVELDTLVAVLEHPTRTFVRRRLGATLPRDAEDLDDRIPLVLAPLDAWASGERLLAAALGRSDLQRAFAAERRRGTMPPGRLGGAALDEVAARADAVATAARPSLDGDASAVDVTVTLPAGRVLAGTVPGVRGRTVTRATYSRLAPKHRLRAWVHVLALAASERDAPAGAWRAVTVGRGPGRRPTASVRTLAAPEHGQAERLLAALVAVHDAALREPLPLPVDPAETYARERAGHAAPEIALDAAQRTLADAFDEDEYDALAWGAGFDLARIAGVPTDLERAACPGEPTRFGTLARLVWDPLLAHEDGGAA
ncbi:exodeoxyribonuclease V subunit gamma [Luteimicrobium subarcticum]|uniref:RecBCD enzyme subunit RecC n=1 Tax=Luteimicrobium subarcticum TaxID=620910 RepID=A0A2M8WW51_9MICO|nr:exodeoxyribonuclease V subunit gamma [Luteimicrobium subarcticum]PJI95143.1 DNA helicase/exodeoxyribonuclease V gamma subunit [Luteimicrobium subarcticum]